MIDSLATLLTGIVDYAGLFPPANLDMEPAVRAYADYLHHPSRFMLGRFVVPVSRLPEFDEASRPLLSRGESSTPWILSVLAGPDVAADVQEALKFNCRHWSNSELGHAVIDSVEIKVSSTADIGAAMSRMPEQFRTFFEIPIDSDPDALLAEIKRAGACAKIRTGGVTADAFPPSTDIARFIKRCQEYGVPFKATAGLHHAIRAQYGLTYELATPSQTMYGYLNVFLAAAFARHGASQAFLVRTLEEIAARAFVFRETSLTYRGETLSTTFLDDVRRTFALSFGSCSFLEPVGDLVVLNLA